MNKRGILFLIFFLGIFFCFSFASSIRINEVESNPIGTDAGNEWIELYNNQEINLTGYRIINNDWTGENDTKNQILLDGNFSGYFIYTFRIGWLDNFDEKVFLYYNNELIYETPLFDDSENDERTWNFCDGEWLFLNSSKNSENNCPVEEPTPEPEEEFINFTNYPTDDVENESLNESNESFQITGNSLSELNSINSEKNSTSEISLNTKDIKTEKNIKLSERNYSWFYLLTFCMLLLLLFLIKRKNKPKNEFRKTH
ncbi:MAG: hypothetical protein WC812_04595 [Candidatus Pacearchaeota archaeon]|jgi:hypothetical protein